MKNTQTQNPWSAEALYDELMQNIEPDLTSDHAALLDQKYKDETPEERTERLQGYELAFLAFDEALADFQLAVTEDLNAFEEKIQSLVLADIAGERSLLEDVDTVSLIG